MPFDADLQAHAAMLTNENKELRKQLKTAVEWLAIQIHRLDADHRTYNHWNNLSEQDRDIWRGKALRKIKEPLSALSPPPAEQAPSEPANVVWQHRSRVLTGSVGLEGSWSDWIDGEPQARFDGRQYDYRRKPSAPAGKGEGK